MPRQELDTRSAFHAFHAKDGEQPDFAGARNVRSAACRKIEVANGNDSHGPFDVGHLAERE
jgi:hypothetical protein